MQILSFNDFILEKANKFNPEDYNKKVYFLRKTEDTENLSGDPRKIVRELNKEAWTNLYKCIGTEDKVTYIDLVSTGTVDEKIIYSLRNKINLATSVLAEDIRKWLI